MSYAGSSSDTGQGICELFSEYFRSTFLDSNFTLVSDGNCTTFPCDLASIEIDPRLVHKQLSSLDLSKSAGPDSLPALFIVRCAEELTVPVSILFSRSLHDGVVPSIWKSAFISPIHKKGDNSKIENYRPISKLCLLAKVFERIVYDQLYSSIISSLNAEQHGFLKGRSTVSNLLLFTDYVAENMDGGSQVDSIYTDFSKAFDRIDHNILLQKLIRLGIRGDLYRWFSSYVLNRSQAITLNGYTSSWTTIPSGVPQGSLLGPLLFAIFINDIGNCFRNSKYLLFADDMKIFRAVNSISDAVLLQDDISRVAVYCEANNLQLNVSKCLTVSFSRKQHPVHFIYTIADQPISRQNIVKDLGVFVDSKLTFESHIDHVVKKAMSALGFIIRNSYSFNSMKTVKILYCSFVRSHLEYACQIWNPNYAVHSTRIERVQKKFSRFLSYKFRVPKITYEERCERFHLLPLHVRRSVLDIRCLTKIAQSKMDCPELVSKIHLNVPSRHCRMRSLLHIPFVRTVHRKNSFFIRASQLCNNIIKTEPLSFDLYTVSPITCNKILNTILLSTVAP